MKKLITTIAIGAFAFLGTAAESDARPHRGGHGHQTPVSQVYVSGYRHGRPVYTEKIYVGRDRHGHAVYKYRTVSAPRHDHRHDHYDSRYDNRRSSGARVSFSFGR